MFEQPAKGLRRKESKMAKETEVKNESSETKTGVNYQVKFEQSEKDNTELQSQFTKVSQDAKTAQETLDLIAENNLVDWDKLNKPEGLPPEDAEPKYVDEATLKKRLEDTERRLSISQTLHEFRISNPDLAAPKYERIVTAELAELVQKNTRAGRLTKSRAELMKEAADNTREFLKEERTKGITESDEKKKKDAEAAGLGSEGTSHSTDAEDEGETTIDYIARRKAERLAKL